jgi:hypothetical protein
MVGRLGQSARRSIASPPAVTPGHKTKPPVGAGGFKGEFMMQLSFIGSRARSQRKSPGRDGNGE